MSLEQLPNQELQNEPFIKTNDPEAKSFDPEGNPRTPHKYPDGTIALKSDQEFAEELKEYNN